MQTIAQKLEAVESSLRRWHTRLTIASNKVAKLDRQRRRLQLEALQPKDAKTVAVVTVKAGKIVDVKPPAPEPVSIETDHISEVDLPAFLDRSNPLIAEEMTAKRKAAEAEARRAMPLSGRAALQAIKRKKK